MNDAEESSRTDSGTSLLKKLRQWCSKPAESRWGRALQLAVYLGLCIWIVKIIFSILEGHGLEDAYLDLAAGLSAIWILNNVGKTWELFVDFSRFLDSGKQFDAFKSVHKVIIPVFVATAVYAFIVGELRDRTDPDSVAGKIVARLDRVRTFMTSDRPAPTDEELKKLITEALAGHSDRLRPILVQIDNDEAVLVPLSSIEKRLDAQKQAINSMARKIDDLEQLPKMPNSQLTLLRMADAEEGPALVHNAVFPIRFGVAKLATFPPSSTFSINQASWRTGVDSGLELTQTQVDDLKLLTDMLKPCMGTSPVVMNVSGHASSLPFKHYGPGEVSNKLNVEAARLRLEAVVSNLTGLKNGYVQADDKFRPESFLINPVRHTSAGELSSNAPFDDTPGGVSSNKQNPAHSLNQAVFIQLQQVGDCARA